MNLFGKLEEIGKKRDEFYKTHYFTQNSKEGFAIPKSIVETKVKQLRFDNTTEEEARKVLGQRWYANCKRIMDLYKFLSKSKYLDRQGNFAVSMISCTLYKTILDNNEKRIFKSINTIRRTLEDMKKMDMLRCVDKHYAKDISKARSYVLSIPRIKSLFYLQKLGETFGSSYEIQSIDEMIDSIENDVVYNVENEINNENCSIEEKELSRIKKYYDELRLREEVTLVNARLRKNVYKYKMTGWRPSAGICYIASKEKAALHKTVHDFYREDVIRHDYGNLTEFDRNASIYNLMVYLGKDEIRENDRNKYDLYNHLNIGLQTLRTGGNIWEYEKRKNDDDMKSNYDYSVKNCNENVMNCNELRENLREKVSTIVNAPTRQDVKNLMMTINFADMRQIRSLVEDSVNFMMSGDHRCEKRAFKFYDRFVSVCRYIGPRELNNENDYLKLSKDMISWFKDAKELLQNFVGDFKIGDKAIFLYEAKVNLHCQNLLISRGFDCVSVYDGFYTNADYDTWWDCYKESLKELKTLIKKRRK